jgi:hypothetical protein
MPTMTLGDFFRSAPHRRPVNPRPVTFTAGSSDRVLPGGEDNPTLEHVAVKIEAAFIFIDVETTTATRAAAHVECAERFADPHTKMPRPLSENEFEFELQVHLLTYAVREYDSKLRKAGGQLFPDAKTLRRLVVPREINRLWKAYTDYVADEHPEVVDTKTFRSAQAGGAGVSVSEPI